MAFAAGAKGIPRHKGHLFRLEQLLGKFQRGQTGFFNGREDVKSAFRFEAFQAHAAKAVDHQAAAVVVFCHHLLHLPVSMTQRLQGGDLGGDRCAQHSVLMDFVHSADELGMAQGVANAPAGHGVGFGKTVEQQRAFLHARKRGERDMLAFVSQISVNFIGNHD